MELHSQEHGTAAHSEELTTRRDTTHSIHLIAIVGYLLRTEHL